MKQLFAALLFSLIAISNISVAGTGTPNVDDMDLISLTVNANKTSVNFSYPGMAPDGQHNSPVPDCLMLVTGGARISTLALKVLANTLEVTDGRGVLFPNTPGAEVNVLKPEIRNGKLFYQIKDLGTYMTRIQVRSKTGQSLASAVRATLGSTPVAALQVVRSCRVVTN